MRDLDKAEDAVQQTLVAIWTDLPELRDPDRFDAWAYRLTVRFCLAEARRNRRVGVTFVGLTDDSRSTPDPTDEVVTRDEIERAFETLTPDHRAVLVLRYQLGLSLPEVALAMGIRYGTVGSQIASCDGPAACGPRRRRADDGGTGGRGMKRSIDLGAALTDWMDTDEVGRMRPRAVEAAVLRARTLPQRRSRGWRWSSPRSPQRLATVAGVSGLVLAAALVVGLLGASRLDPFQEVAAPTLAAPSPASAMDQELATRLTAALEGALEESGAPGVQAAVILGDGSVWTAGAGTSTPGEPMTADLLMAIGSITKVYTTALILDLVDDSVLDLDDPLSRWVADVPHSGGVTIRQVLNHTSGIASDDPALDPVCDPGSCHSYSNGAFRQLGAVIERADGQRFIDSLRQRILTPFDLGATFYPRQESVIATSATGHDNGEELSAWDVATLGDRPASEGVSGDLVATAADTARFAHELLTGAVLSPGENDTLLDFEATRGLPGTNDCIAIGMSVLRHSGDHGESWFFGGQTGFFRAWVEHYPTQGVTVAVITNANVPPGVFLGGLAREALADAPALYPTTVSGSCNTDVAVRAADGTVGRVTTGPDFDGFPTWSPDGQRLAWGGLRDGRQDIFVSGADGSDPVRLTDDDARDIFPRWSPDGSAIAFSSDRDGDFDIYLMAPDGSAVRQLTHNDWDEFVPTWSPDGSRIAYVSTGDGQHIRVMDADGTTDRTVTSGEGREDWPAWAPDGQRIAYESGGVIFIVPVDGGEPVRLPIPQVRVTTVPRVGAGAGHPVHLRRRPVRDRRSGHRPSPADLHADDRGCGHVVSRRHLDRLPAEPLGDRPQPALRDHARAARTGVAGPYLRRTEGQTSGPLHPHGDSASVTASPHLGIRMPLTIPHRPSPTRPDAGWARRRLPGPRGAVVAIAALLVVGLAVTVAETVAGHVTATAVDEAVLSVETIVRGDVDELLTASAMTAPGPDVAATINTRLERLTADNLLRIKVWAPDGTVVFSDFPALRGRSFEVSHELEEALAGEVETELTAPSADENIFERDLADRVLEVYLPLRDPTTGTIIGAYEVYHDAAQIEAHVDATRRDALVVVGIAGAGLLLLLYLGFSGTARRLSSQNRLLREQTLAQELLAVDLRRSEERFRSLVHNSADIIAVLDPDGTVRYASPAVERMLGYPADDRIGRSMLEILHPDDQERAATTAGGDPADRARPGIQRAPIAAPRRRLAGHRRGRHQPAGGPRGSWHRAQLARCDRPQAAGGAAHPAGLPRQPDRPCQPRTVRGSGRTRADPQSRWAAHRRAVPGPRRLQVRQRRAWSLHG